MPISLQRVLLNGGAGFKVASRHRWAIRTAFLLLAVACLVWAIWGTGVPTPAIRWTLVVAGLAFALLMMSEGTSWNISGRWLALALVGQACALQLVSAGKISHPQLFHPWREILGTYRGVFLLVIFLQGLAVLWFVHRRWSPKIWRWLKGASPVSVAVFLFLCVFASVSVAPNTVRAFESESGALVRPLVSEFSRIALGLLLSLTGALNLALIAATVPYETLAKIHGCWETSDRRRLPWIAALWVVIVAALLAWFAFDRLPHIPDETAYLFHAKYFAAGKLWLPAPPEPDAFLCTMTIYDADRWYSSQLPGWPLVLAIGARAGLHWMVNPVLGGLAILLAHWFVRRLYDRTTADATILLLAFSPWFLYISASLMGHAVCLIFFLAGLLGAESARNRASLLGSLVAGISFGALAATRPLEALATAALIGVWWLTAGWQKLRVAALATAVIAGLAVSAAHLAYNRVVTGDAFLLPFEQMMDKLGYHGINRVGFGPDVGSFGWTHLDPLPGHGLADVLVNANQNSYMVHFELFGWACGSLLLVFFLASTRRFKSDLLQWGLLFAVGLGMSFYWYGGGADLGARYWYLMILPCVVLTVRAAQWLSQTNALRAEGFGQRVWLFLILATFIGFVNVVPWRAIDKYSGYRSVTGEVRRLDQRYGFGRSLVFVRGEVPSLPWRSSVYTAAFALNPLTYERDEAGPIYVRDLGEESRERLRRYYSDRPAWILADPSMTGRGFQVLEGPLPPLLGGPSALQ